MVILLGYGYISFDPSLQLKNFYNFSYHFSIMVDPTLVYWIISAGPDYSKGAAMWCTRRTPGATMRFADKAMDDMALWRFEPHTSGGVTTYAIRNVGSNLYINSVSNPGGAGQTSTINTNNPQLYALTKVENDDSYLLTTGNNDPLHAQNGWHMIVTWNAREKGSASCWKIIPATDEELLAIQKKKDDEQTYSPVWVEDFNQEGPWNPDDWVGVEGFIRNWELQWYQPQNVWIEDGNMVIKGIREDKPNPWYDPNSKDWRYSRKWINYTSGSLITAGKRDWTYGRFEARMKIPTASGAWPAFWTLGYEETMGQWPDDGEIDIMEYYNNHTLLNVCWGGWETAGGGVPLYDYWVKRVDPNWINKYHRWRMDWDEEAIKLYLDDELVTVTLLSRTINSKGVNPFHYPQYIVVNVAMGATGGQIHDKDLPFILYIDYIHIYQMEKHRKNVRASGKLSHKPGKMID